MDVKLINTEADADPETIRISVDTKATIIPGEGGRADSKRSRLRPVVIRVRMPTASRQTPRPVRAVRTVFYALPDRAICMEFHIELFHTGFQQFNQMLSAGVIREDFTRSLPAGHMINGAWIIHAQRSCHNGLLFNRSVFNSQPLFCFLKPDPIPVQIEQCMEFHIELLHAYCAFTKHPPVP